MDEVDSILLNSDLDVLVLSDTWLHKNVNNSLITNDNYTIFRSDRKTVLPSSIVKKGGGLCMYIRKGISVDPVQCVTVSDENIKITHLNLKKGFEKRFNVVGVYRPPSGNLISGMDILDEKSKEIKQLCKGETVAIGDFNVDFSKGGDHKSIICVHDMLDNHGLSQIIKMATRKTAVHESQIDLIFTDIRFISDYK